VDYFDAFSDETERIVSSHVETRTEHLWDTSVELTAKTCLSMYGMITNDVSDYIHLLVRIAHIICNQLLSLKHNIIIVTVIHEIKIRYKQGRSILLSTNYARVETDSLLIRHEVSTFVILKD
jgi:hypothetical protein